MKIEREKLWDGYTKEEKILVANILDKAEKYKCTGVVQYSNFLDPYQSMIVKRALEERNIDYQMIRVDECCEQTVFLFGTDLFPVTIYRGTFSEPLYHSDILGTLFSIGLERNLIGDIFVEEGCFYLTNLERMNSFLENHLYKIKHQVISLEKVEKITLEKEKYQKISLIISSYRLDHIISLISKKSRSQSLEILKKKDVILNYQVVTDGTIQLKEGDIFSIRHIGKFRFGSTLKSTKKQKMVVEIWKYL